MASRPFYQLADRVLGSKFLEDIAEFFLNFQSMYAGFVERAAVGRAAAARPPHDVRGRHHARSGTAARGRAVLRDAARPELPPRCDGVEQDAPRLRCSIPTAAARRGAIRRPDRSARRGVVGPAESRARQMPNARAGCCAPSRESFANFAVVAMREAELRAELTGVPDVVVRVPGVRARHQRRRRARGDHPRAVSPTRDRTRSTAVSIVA